MVSNGHLRAWRFHNCSQSTKQAGNYGSSCTCGQPPKNTGCRSTSCTCGASYVFLWINHHVTCADATLLKTGANARNANAKRRPMNDANVVDLYLHRNEESDHSKTKFHHRRKDSQGQLQFIAIVNRVMRSRRRWGERVTRLIHQLPTSKYCIAFLYLQ